MEDNRIKKSMYNPAYEGGLLHAVYLQTTSKGSKNNQVPITGIAYFKGRKVKIVPNLLQFMRMSGFYWLKTDHSWIVGEWSQNHVCWYLCGNDGMFDDSDFLEINENQIKI